VQTILKNVGLNAKCWRVLMKAKHKANVLNV